jgi:hypothetical protein
LLAQISTLNGSAIQTKQIKVITHSVISAGVPSNVIASLQNPGLCLTGQADKIHPAVRPEAASCLFP